MSKKEQYKKLHSEKLREFVITKNKLDKLERQIGLLEQWLAIEELEEEAASLEAKQNTQGDDLEVKRK
jgi:hypothetical protein